MGHFEFALIMSVHNRVLFNIKGKLLGYSQHLEALLDPCMRSVLAWSKVELQLMPYHGPSHCIRNGLVLNDFIVFGEPNVPDRS